MSDHEGYLSREKAHLARLQRERRARTTRIDYTPGKDALAILESKRGPWYPLNTNNGVIDTILAEWADLTGITAELVRDQSSTNEREPTGPHTQARLSRDAERSARTNDFGTATGISPLLAGARGRAYEFEGRPNGKGQTIDVGRLRCGAKRHRDGNPCQALSEPGKRRCRFHGGRSTGPRTPEGKVRALANLRRGRKRKSE